MKYTSPTVVPIIMVMPSSPYFGNTKKMMEVLQRQGQIEPLQVMETEGNVVSPHPLDVHGNDIIRAARVLGWPTLLIVTTKRYEG